jgi:hypothetical protein
MTGPQGRSFPLEVYVKGPGKRAAYVQMAQGMNVTAFDGTRAWRSSPGRPARELSAAETEGARLDADLRFPVNVKKLYKQFEVEAAPKIDGRDVWLVTARNPGQPPLRLYLDASSGLLVRMTRYIETPIGRNPTEIDFQDYRDADGIKLPFKWAIAQPGGRSTYEVTEAKANVPVDDAKFTMPAEAAK